VVHAQVAAHEGTYAPKRLISSPCLQKTRSRPPIPKYISSLSYRVALCLVRFTFKFCLRGNRKAGTPRKSNFGVLAVYVGFLCGVFPDIGDGPGLAIMAPWPLDTSEA
jgi:hypothetical protein